MINVRIPLEEYLAQQGQDMAQRCTTCGKCFEACPMVAYTPLDPSNGKRVMAGVRDIFRAGVVSQEGKIFADACTGTGDCLDVCPEGIDPMKMLRLARTKAQQLAARSAAPGQRPSGPTWASVVDLVRALVLKDSDLRWYVGKVPEGVQADVVMMLGCNITRTANLALACVDVLTTLGLGVEVVGGRGYCCGNIGSKEGSLTSLSTYNAFSSMGAKEVLTFCPTCFTNMTGYADEYIEHEFDTSHITHFLAEHFDRLQASIKKPFPHRVALHEHGGKALTPTLYQDIRKVLGAIPGIELVELEQFPYGYQCGPAFERPNPAAYKATLQKLCEEASKADFEYLITPFQSCHRDLCTAEKHYPFKEKAFILLVAEAMGFDYGEDLYKKYKIMADPDAIMWEARDYIALSGYAPERFKPAIAIEFSPLADKLAPVG